MSLRRSRYYRQKTSRKDASWSIWWTVRLAIIVCKAHRYWSLTTWRYRSWIESFVGLWLCKSNASQYFWIAFTRVDCCQSDVLCADHSVAGTDYKVLNQVCLNVLLGSGHKLGSCSMQLILYGKVDVRFVHYIIRADLYVAKIGKNLQRTDTICVGQSISRNGLAAKTPIIKILSLQSQIYLNTAQRFSSCQLSKCHNQELIQAT